MKRSDMLAMVERLGHRALVAAPDSEQTFADGSRYRIEIPSVEGPAVLRVVLEESARLGVPIDRISQGSGVMMLRDDEISEMVELGRQHQVEINLFLGPRAAWDIGGQAKVTASVAATARGNEMVAACLNDAHRAVTLGVRSLLVGDLGVLGLLGRLKSNGELPDDLVLKTSVLLPLSNGPTAAIYQGAGATSLNVSTDLTVAQIAELRQAATATLDVYVEVPDDQGGAVRFYDVPELVRVAAPVYLKLGVRNAAPLYPCGHHLATLAENLGRERVRRAALVLQLLGDLAPELAARP